MILDFKAMPKAEVHVHLEGCLSLTTIALLAKENGVALPQPKEDLLKFVGLADFLGLLDIICGLPRTTDQLATAAYAFCERIAADGTGYADLIVNPTHWKLWYKNLAGFLDGLDAGFKAAEQDGLPSLGFAFPFFGNRPAMKRSNWSIFSLIFVTKECSQYLSMEMRPFQAEPATASQKPSEEPSELGCAKQSTPENPADQRVYAMPFIFWALIGLIMVFELLKTPHSWTS